MNTTTTTMNPAASVVPGIADRAHQVIDRAADKAAPALDRARTSAHNTVDKVADSAATSVEWAATNGKEIARKGNELSEVACGYVRERPLTAVAGAVAVGYLVGRLMR